ncbi:Z1 domain-containing protein [Streptomyces kurssanovii]|uniref:Z1 domain-containing protein n=1 Tax=Streptomyces kurssanovii TaxID=67312 RepID=A0ABV3I0N4_9ACTN
MPDTLLKIHTSALAAMQDGPRPFGKWAALVADEDDPDADLTEENFRARLMGSDAGAEALKSLWSRTLTSWDFAEAPEWAPNAAPRTEERRATAYDLLRLSTDLRKALDAVVPVPEIPPATVITREFTPWYTPEKAAARTFYWSAYERKLWDKGWSDAAIASLDEASRAVVERLADPEQPEARQTKGLVVGYVQSGKTANFTGVTAKAIDAGYRLVIVLAGTLNLLRAQTQRRLDMELIGQENILRGADPGDVDSLVGIDYVGDDDNDWPHFIRHGGRPSTLGAFDIERLTTRDNDYKSLAQGIRALEYDKREPTRPLHDPVNLHRTAARMVVVKKNKSVLTKLVKDLKQIHGLLGELPVLIIDDESDQASVNTSNPKKWEQGRTERTAINALISQLLGLLPRAQYVGYTATPFANVFVDPGDSEDIFPSDFLISLPRPAGYMGVQDFHDLDSAIPYEERTYANSQEKAHVRGIGPDMDDRLLEAMDSFVLSGALKLFRADHGVPDGPFRHHTMLVHESVKVDDHADLALRINTMWHQAGYASVAGHERLEALWQTDFAPVSTARADGLPVPESYAALRPYVSGARQRIGSGGNPVVIVNGNSDKYFEQLDLDFDRTPHVWKILVGGTKLSRGFTIEGLTTTYYRRTTQQADTLMQMGRWFGFRPGYRDLVRLYIGREEPLTKTRTVDLYEAFEAICQDEELFRAQLVRYSALVDGRPQVTPAQIPPLVSQHLPWIKPSGRSKMFNAELVEIRSPGQWVEPTAYPVNAPELRHNSKAWQPVLAALGDDPMVFVHLDGEDRGGYTRYPAKTAVISHTQLLTTLGALNWARPGLLSPHLQYLSDSSTFGCGTDDWVVIAPQTSGPSSVAATILGSSPLTLVQRRRNARGAFNRISGVAHRQSAERIAGLRGLSEDDPYATVFHQPRRGAVLLYAIADPDLGSPSSLVSDGRIDPGKVVLAASFIPSTPPNTSPVPYVRFRAADSSAATRAIVEAQ